MRHSELFTNRQIVQYSKTFSKILYYLFFSYNLSNILKNEDNRKCHIF